MSDLIKAKLQQVHSFQTDITTPCVAPENSGDRFCLKPGQGFIIHARGDFFTVFIIFLEVALRKSMIA